MKRTPLLASTLVLGLALTFGAATPARAADPDIVDPVTGETMAVSELDFASLSADERRNVGDQLAELGYRMVVRHPDPDDLDDVTVTDPTTGEETSLGDIDMAGLSAEDRRAIGDQLAEQGITPGRRPRGGQSDDSSDDNSDETDSDTTDSAETDSDNGARSDRGRRPGKGPRGPRGDRG